MAATEPRYTERLTIRLSAAEASGLSEAAAALGLSPSEALRRMVRAVGGLPLSADAHLRPAAEALAEQLRRIGVNLNQVVRAMHEGRVGVDAELGTALDHLVLALEAAQLLYGELGRRPRAQARAALGLAAERAS